MKNTVKTYDNLFNCSAMSVHRNAIYGFAALWIVAFHLVDMMKHVKATFPGTMRFFWDTFSLGNIGVDIFLFLSGVGLYYSFSKDGRVLRFYYKRMVRILVPFVLLCVPYMIYLFASGRMSAGVFIQNVTTVNYWLGNTSPLNLWYIPAILVLYLLYPLIYKVIFCRERGALARCLVLAAVSIAITFTLFIIYGSAKGGLYKRWDTFLPRVATFIVGCWFGKPVKEKKSYSPWVLFGAIAVVIMAYPLYAQSILKGPFNRYYGCLTGIALVFILSQFFELFKNINLGNIFAFFGTFSLEIYLLHIEARNWYMSSPLIEQKHYYRDYAILAICAIAAAYLASLVEKPIVKLLMKPLNKDKQK